MPKAVRSHKESYCSPKALVLFVNLATVPSSPSKTMANNMASEAQMKFPCIEATIA